MSESIASVPSTVPATTTAPQPSFPAHIPQFAPVKHPLRFSIVGRKHLIPNLKDMIAADPVIPDHYKAVIQSELDGLKSNAAQVDVHVVDHPNGDISFSGHIKPIQLG